jgi:cystathionine beta-lyase
VLSFTTGSGDISKAIAEHAKFFRITVSFGSVNSSISMPGSMSHASVPPEVMAERKMPADLVRISVGIEDEEDLMGDLDRAIHAAMPRTQVAIGS